MVMVIHDHCMTCAYMEISHIKNTTDVLILLLIKNEAGTPVIPALGKSEADNQKFKESKNMFQKLTRYKCKVVPIQPINETLKAHLQITV